MHSRQVKSFLEFVNENQKANTNPEYLYSPEAEVLRDAGLLPELSFRTASEAILYVIRKRQPIMEKDIIAAVQEFDREARDGRIHPRTWTRDTISIELGKLLRREVIQRKIGRNPMTKRQVYLYSLT